MYNISFFVTKKTYHLFDMFFILDIKKDNRNDPIISKRIFYFYHSFVNELKSDKF